MRKSKWMILQMFVLIAVFCLLVSIPKAKADANLMENGSVFYVRVSDGRELQAFVNNNGMYSSKDYVEESSENYGNTYKIILEEAGTLYIYPLSQNTIYMKFHLYSNFQLTSELMEKSYVNGTGQSYYWINLEPGTYYYRAERRYADLDSTVYLGFSSRTQNDSIDTSSANQYENTKYEEVNYTIVQDEDDLVHKIHNNLMYSSQDIITSDWRGTTKAYQISVDQPGTLVFAPVQMNNAAYLYVYSNTALTSRLLKADYIDSIHTERLYHLAVEPGTYYYQSSRWNNLGDLTLTVYIGFIPQNSSDNYSASLNESEITDSTPSNTIYPKVVNSIQGFTDSISSRKPDFTDMINSNYNQGEVHSFTLPESGYLFVCATSDNDGYYKYNVYDNMFLDSRFIDGKEIINVSSTSLKDKTTGIYLDAGTYYYQAYRWNGWNSADIKAYLGYIPSSSIIAVDNIDISQDKTKAVVHFSVNDLYNPDQQKAMIRIEKGKIYARSADYSNIWKVDTLENAIESHDFIVTENGHYTARIAGNTLQTHLVQFEVTGLEESDPLPEETSATPSTEITGEAVFQDAKTNTDLSLREHPDKHANSTKYLSKGTIVQVLRNGKNEKGEEWCYVRTDVGAGYAMTQDLEFAQEKTNVPDPEENISDESSMEVLPELSPAELRKYIRTLEDQIEDLGLELPEFAASDTQDEYMKKLEKVLQDNGYDI